MQLSPELRAYAEAHADDARWFSGHSLTWIRASADGTEGRLSLVEHLVPPGSASPWHVHHTEDESFYVVSGRLSVIVDGQPPASLGPGGFAFGPRGVPHAFRVEGSDVARLLLMASGPEFAAFIREASDPVDVHRLPEATAADAGRLRAAAAAHGIEILGPPPA